jgi:hypothetical protein
MMQTLLDWLMDVHYLHFMQQRAFWYRRDLQAHDMRCCVLASNLRAAMRKALLAAAASDTTRQR